MSAWDAWRAACVAVEVALDAGQDTYGPVLARIAAARALEAGR